MNNSKGDIGKRIRQTREGLGLNQTQFGEKVALSKNMLSKYETGDSYQRVHILCKISTIGQVSLDWLITGNEKKADIPLTITPGNDKAKQRLKDQSNRPTSKITHLKWIIEWMDLYFKNNDEQALLFYEDLKDLQPSFTQFIEREKKQTSKDHKDRPLDNLSNGT